METQRRFSVMGENLFKTLKKIISNQRVCRLLKYQNSTPFDPFLPDIDGLDLLHKQIVIVPKIPEVNDKECSYIYIVFDKYIINPENRDYKISTIRFDIVCPFKEWIIDDNNLRPYLLMQEIDNMFNESKMSGIGKLQFSHCIPLILSPELGGYEMYYQINEFN